MKVERMKKVFLTIIYLMVLIPINLTAFNSATHVSVGKETH